LSSHPAQLVGQHEFCLLQFGEIAEQPLFLPQLFAGLHAPLEQLEGGQFPPWKPRFPQFWGAPGEHPCVFLFGKHPQEIEAMYIVTKSMKKLYVLFIILLESLSYLYTF